MGASGRQRHRDRDPGRRIDAEPPPNPKRVFKMSDAERQLVAAALRHIDAARRAIAEQQLPANREIIRELKASADHIYDVINGLEELG